MKKKKFSIWKIFRNIILTLISAVIIWVIVHHTLSAYEEKKYPPVGQVVEVDGKNMHVFTKGEGLNTIVLLSGLGTTAPVLDYEPLINELAKSNKVVVVEPFGYGWSELTNKERTVENIVEETRTALMKMDIKGPYILMPHSISGIYSMYYANKYPEEVKAIIGIDPTFPQALEYFNEPAPSSPKFMSLIEPTGIARLAVNIIPEDFLPIAEDGTYSKENLQMTKVLTASKLINKNIVAEGNEISRNVEKTKNMAFPEDLPVLIFTINDFRVTEDGKSNKTFYESQLEKVKTSKLVQLEGHHYLHWTQYKEITETTNEFMETKH